MMRKPGYLFDPPDERDKRFGFHQWYDVGDQADEVNLWLPGMRMEHQGETAACTGYAGAYAARVAIAHERGADPGPMSPMYLYYVGRAIWDGEDEDGGSYVRTMFKAMQLQGCAREEKFPQSVGVFKQPTWTAVKDGFKHRGLRSYRLISSVDAARAALTQGMPLVGGWQCGPGFWAWNGGDAFGQLETEGNGHCMAVMGYDRFGNFLLPDSYGEGVGESGWHRVTADWLLSGGRLWAFDMRTRR